MSAKPTILHVFCLNKAENAGRPSEPGRTDVTLAVLRPTHVQQSDKAPVDDPNPGVFANTHSGGNIQFGDVTDEFAAKFKRGARYKLTIEEV